MSTNIIKIVNREASKLNVAITNHEGDECNDPYITLTLSSPDHFHIIEIDLTHKQADKIASYISEVV